MLVRLLLGNCRLAVLAPVALVRRLLRSFQRVRGAASAVWEVLAESAELEELAVSAELAESVE